MPKIKYIFLIFQNFIIHILRERDVRRAPFLRGFEVFFGKIAHFKTETMHDVYVIIYE